MSEKETEILRMELMTKLQALTDEDLDTLFSFMVAEGMLTETNIPT